MKDILIIGGSRFVGPLLIKKLLSKGHRLTVFNRGIIRSKYDEKIKFIMGDRDEDFIKIRDGYDAVVDMCSFCGPQTEKAIDKLNFDFFIHISTAAVYKKTENLPLTEKSPLGGWPLWGDYNKGKVECEKALEKSGKKYASLRPAYILGPKNYCDRERFIYSRIRNNRPLILPGNGKAIIQFVFAEEVADSIAAVAEKRAVGAFNCAGNETITLVDLVKIMGKIAGRKPILRFNPLADGENFNEAEFPFADENMICDNGKIKKVGIKFRPLISGLKDDYENYYRHVI